MIRACKTSKKTYAETCLVNDIVGFLDSQQHADNLIGCSKVFHPTVRRDGKWNMPVESYPTNQYPLGCVGWCFVLSANVIQAEVQDLTASLASSNDY